MAVNPMELLHLKERLTTFENEHPRFIAYLDMLKHHAIQEGAVLEMKVTTPDGKDYVANIRMTANDVETLRLLTGLNRN